MQKLQPKNEELYIAAGQAQQAMGNSEKALESYQQAIKVNGGEGTRAWDAYLKIGDLFRQMQDYGQALKALDAAVELAPEEAEPRIQRGAIHQATDNYDASEMVYSWCHELRVSHAD